MLGMLGMLRMLGMVRVLRVLGMGVMGILYMLVGRKQRRGEGDRVSVQQMGVRDSDGDVGLFRLLRTTVHRVARDRLLRWPTRLDGGGGRWAGDSRTFEALK